MQGQVNAALFRPSRWNFAHVCRWCGTWQCQSLECVAAHEASWWAPCDDCWGGAADESLCYCSGVEQMASREYAEQRVREFFAFVGVNPGVQLRAVA